MTTFQIVLYIFIKFHNLFFGQSNHFLSKISKTWGLLGDKFVIFDQKLHCIGSWMMEQNYLNEPLGKQKVTPVRSHRVKFRI